VILKAGDKIIIDPFHCLCPVTKPVLPAPARSGLWPAACDCPE